MFNMDFPVSATNAENARRGNDYAAAAYMAYWLSWLLFLAWVVKADQIYVMNAWWMVVVVLWRLPKLPRQMMKVCMCLNRSGPA